MTRIHLLDPEGRPRLVLNQPEPVKDTTLTLGWLAVFAAMAGAPDGKEIEVQFNMARQGPATAILGSGQKPRMDVTREGDIEIFLCARDIIPGNDLYL